MHFLVKHLSFHPREITLFLNNNIEKKVVNNGLKRATYGNDRKMRNNWRFSLSIFYKRHTIENLRLNIEDVVHVDEKNIKILSYIYK